MVVKAAAEAEEFAYVRVSTKEQNEARQLEALKHLNIKERNLVIEKESGKNFADRPKYQALKQRLRAGDTLFIKELDRLGRNAEEIKAEWRELTEMDIYIVILDMPILDTRTYKNGLDKLIANIVLELLSYMAEREREKIHTRQREGIDAAKKAGNVVFGRPKVVNDQFNKMYALVKAGELTAVSAMKQLGMKANTYYRRVKEYEEVGV